MKKRYSQEYTTPNACNLAVCCVESKMRVRFVNKDRKNSHFIVEEEEGGKFIEVATFSDAKGAFQIFAPYILFNPFRVSIKLYDNPMGFTQGYSYLSPLGVNLICYYGNIYSKFVLHPK